MELKLLRKYFTEHSTVSELYVNGSLLCNVLEDVDRGLHQEMDLASIKKIKVHGRTAIPYGTYLIANTYSPRFQKYLPLLLNVPGYAGIRIHPGNKADDTEGCLLPGKYDLSKPDWVSDSRINFNLLFDMIKKVEKKEKITISIEKYEQTEKSGDTV